VPYTSSLFTHISQVWVTNLTEMSPPTSTYSYRLESSRRQASFFWQYRTLTEEANSGYTNITQD